MLGQGRQQRKLVKEVGEEYADFNGHVIFHDNAPMPDPVADHGVNLPAQKEVTDAEPDAD